MNTYIKNIPIKLINYKNNNLIIGRYISKIIPLILNFNIKLNIINIQKKLPLKFQKLKLKLKSYKHIKQFSLKYIQVINKEILLSKGISKMLPKIHRKNYIKYFNI